MICIELASILTYSGYNSRVYALEMMILFALISSYMTEALLLARHFADSDNSIPNQNSAYSNACRRIKDFIKTLLLTPLGILMMPIAYFSQAILLLFISLSCKKADENLANYDETSRKFIGLTVQ